MFSNLKSAFQKALSKQIEHENDDEDIQAIIILLLEACQIDGTTEQAEINFIKNLLINKFDFTKEESEAGYKNFCVVKCKIKSIEWLYLAAKGHRRALIDFQGSKKFSWLIP